MEFNVEFSEQQSTFKVDVEEQINIKGGTGTSDYNSLKNKPKINDIELRGSKTLDELGIQPKGDYITNNTLETELEDVVDTFNVGMTTKQDKLVSGTNIKTINNQSILGGGNIEIETEETDPTVPNHVKQISESDITNWNNKSEFSGSYNDLTNKPTIPTNNNQLINGAGYQTEDEVIDMINNAFAGVSGIEYQVVTVLPAIGKAGVIYLISNGGSNPNIYDEYIYVNNSFEKIGTTETDLSGYATKEELSVVIPYKASYTSVEKSTYGAKIFSCFDSSYSMLKPLFVSVSGLLLSYTGRINDSTLSFGLAITDVTNGVHFVDYLMVIDTTSQTLQSITAEPAIELVDDEELAAKQDILVSGTNIKTINGNSILGSGNIEIEGGSGSSNVTVLEASTTNVIDFNTLTAPGYYLIKNANTSTTTNSPITDTGTYDMPLEVEKTTLASGENEYEQLAEGGIVYRKYTNGEWYDWGNVTDDMYQMTKTYTDTGLASKSTATNLANGTATGSLKHINAYDDSDNGLLGEYAFAEGRKCVATGKYSHAEGSSCIAYSKASHVEGYYTLGNGVTGSHIQGEYNIKDNNKEMLHIVGNGSETERSNAHTLDTSGNAWFAGDVYVSSTSGKNKDSGSKKLATEEYVNNAIGIALSGSY